MSLASATLKIEYATQFKIQKFALKYYTYKYERTYIHIYLCLFESSCFASSNSQTQQPYLVNQCSQVSTSSNFEMQSRIHVEGAVHMTGVLILLWLGDASASKITNCVQYDCAASGFAWYATVTLSKTFDDIFKRAGEDGVMSGCEVSALGSL